MYNIRIEKWVQNFLRKHKWEKIITHFYDALKILQQSPVFNILDISPLKWYKNKYRLRIWKYRFLYEIDNYEITIVFFDAGSRGDIYKKI